MRHSRTALFSALLLAFAAPAAFSSSFAEPAARMQRAPAGQALAHAQGLGAAATVGAALRAQGADEATARSLVAGASRTGKAGITHVRLSQQVDGLAIYGSDIKASFDAQGNLLHLSDRLAAVPAAAPRAAAISERQALDAAMAQVHPGVKAAFSAGAKSGNTQAFKGGGYFHEDPQVTRVLVPQDDGSLAQGFVVQTWSAKGNQLQRTLVGGDGSVLLVEQRTQNDSYFVFLKDPAQGPQTTVAGSAASPAASPSGWLGTGAQTTTTISGNNASAYLDKDANNAPDAGGAAVADGNFVTAANLAVAPDTTGNKAVAVQNLFYLNNRVHDILHGHGFDEAAGNFQVDNFGRGGAGNDPVNAEAQDGGGTDNANFATPADGSRPRMQMYLWTGQTPPYEVVVGAARYDATGAAFGPALNTTGVNGSIALASDSGGVSSTDACEAVSNTVSGKFALVDRGTCDFAVKVTNVQRAGAIGMIVANNAAGAPITMGGSPKAIKIPSVMVSQADGNTLKSLLGSAATLRKKAVAPLQVDGDLDSDVVYHEYGHGLTWRMIGGMSGPLAGAIGEGASDTVAFMINGRDRIGVYASSTPGGIRRYPYAGYPLKYSNVTGAGVHNDGEIYAATMWRLRELWLGSGRTGDSLFDAFVDGMNYTPSTPAYEHMRNGMLQSIAASGAGDAAARCALVWQAFAQFQIGDGAKGTVTRRGTVTITPSTVARSDCSH